MSAAGIRSSVLVLVLLAAAGAAHGQVVMGRLTDDGENRPVANAFVELLDAADVRLAAAITDSVGRFVLRAPAAGEYRLRAERIGYESVISPILTLGAAPLSYEFTLSPRALILPQLDARADDNRGCERRPDGQAVYALWDAVRKALTIASWSTGTGALRYSLMNHVRELDPSMKVVRREERTPKYALAAIPYGALDPEQLARSGYILEDGDGYVLLGLDANVLLSDAFLGSHCFRLVRSREENLIGLGFEPLRSDDRTDVKGVLWVDRRTSELQYLAFEYENLPGHLEQFGASGEVHFERLTNGIWIVKRWWIRSPIVATRAGSRRMIRVGHREDGGTVTSAAAIDTELYGLRGSGVIEGVVRDSMSRAPLPGALVFLSGTPFTAVTDATGSYRIAQVPRGSYTIGFTHAVLEELAVPLSVDTITITGSVPVRRTFSAPSTATLLRALCPGVEEEATSGLLYGTVHDQASGDPLPGVEVRVSWVGLPPSGTGDMADRWRTDHTDRNGRYTICWLPTDTELEVRVDSRRVAQRSLMIDMGGAPLLRRDFD